MIKQHDDGEANKVTHLPYLIKKNSCFAQFAIARALFTFTLVTKDVMQQLREVMAWNLSAFLLLYFVIEKGELLDCCPWV